MLVFPKRNGTNEAVNYKSTRTFDKSEWNKIYVEFAELAAKDF